MARRSVLGPGVWRGFAVTVVLSRGLDGSGHRALLRSCSTPGHLVVTSCIMVLKIQILDGNLFVIWYNFRVLFSLNARVTIKQY